jgi:hypothetical protein
VWPGKIGQNFSKPPLSFDKNKMNGPQGDQIGRIFDYREIAYFEQFFKIKLQK